MALLSSARNHRHSYLAETVYNRMKSLFPGNKSYLVSASILVSNTYASIGENQKAEQVRNDRLKHYGQKVKAGVTWTTIDGQIMVKLWYTLKNSSANISVCFTGV